MCVHNNYVVFMVNITLSIDSELKAEMDKHPSIKWSSVVRSVIQQKLFDFVESERIAKKSKLTMKDFEGIGKRISKAAGKHAGALLNESHR